MSTAPVPLSHTGPGTPESTWWASDRWDGVGVLDLPAVVQRYAQVLVLSAHPDDETLGVGGLLADLADAGAAVSVLVATDGERSHPLRGARARAALAARRRREVQRAVRVLAPTARVNHLGLADGALAQHEEALVEEVRRRTDPDTLVLAPWLADGHPDHDALGRACAVAVSHSGADLAHYPIWLWHWGAPESLPWHDVVANETSRAAAWRKRAGLAEFPTQTAAWGDTASMGGAVAPVLGPEAFAGSFYEERRRALVLSLLGCRRYGRALEIGCAEGRLTEALLDRCDEVVALDTSHRAVTAAQARAPKAVVVQGMAPNDVPAGTFDLVLLSEVGYFLTPLELLATLRRCAQSLAPGGELVLCHWQHPTELVPLDGALVHEQAATALSLERRATYLDEDVRIEVWGGGGSLARREGRG